MGDVPVWLQVFLAAMAGAVPSIIAVIRLASSFDKRLQRLENHNLDQHIDTRISQDWHEHRAPMLQTRVFADLDKMNDNVAKLQQNVAVLLERDRLNTRLEKIIAALNKKAMVTDDEE